MASNSSSEYKVIADKIVSPDEDIIVNVRGDMYKGSINEANRYVTASEVLSNQELSPLPSFLTYTEGRDALPTLNENFGWNSAGVWFGPTAVDGEGGQNSYPIFSDFTVGQDTKTVVSFDVNILDNCSDIGVCVYVDGDTPVWSWGTDSTRIAAQFNCPSPYIYGTTSQVDAAEAYDVPENGTYRVVFTYDPTAATDKVIFQYFALNSEVPVTTLTLDNSLDSGSYRIGFASDTDPNDMGSTGFPYRTYISNLSIDIDNGDTVYQNSLQEGYSGGGNGGVLDLTVPVAIKDGDNVDFITFTRTGTGTARIATPQDDLSLRSARDITLIAGDDGPGNVYIGWGDATITPNATNRVATIADIQSAGTGDITFVDSTISNETGDDIVIQNVNQAGAVKARITLDQSNEQVLVEALRENDDWFNDSQWSTAVWSGTSIAITSTPDIITFFDTVPGNITRISVNNDDTITYGGASYGSGNITIDVGGTPPGGQDPLTVTEIRFYYSQSSKMDINYDNGSFDIVSNGMSMLIDSSGDLELNARDEDIDLRANDDIRFTANWNAGGTEAQWRLTNNGRFELPGDGYIENVIDGSGDGYNNDSIKIVPDAELVASHIDHVDQYLVIDPTAPDHVHIRTGGAIDESTATLILGGEKNSVIVSDEERAVGITTRYTRIENDYGNSNEASNGQFMVASGADIQVGYTVNVSGIDFAVTEVTDSYPYAGLMTVVAAGASFVSGETYTFVYEPPFTHLWQFTSDGVLSGPAMGGVRVPALANQADGDDLLIYATGADIDIQANDGAITLAGNGEFLNDSSVPGNQIATIGDLDNTVSNGMVRYSPTFTATGLAFTGSGATYPTYNSYYVKSGSMVSFVIEVDLTTVTNFGTGQYKLQLPFTPAVGFNHFSGWAWADPNVDPDTGTGHTIINADTAGVTDVLDLHYLKSAGGANAPIREGLFLQGTPVTLTTISKIYVNGTYIAVTEAP